MLRILREQPHAFEYFQFIRAFLLHVPAPEAGQWPDWRLGEPFRVGAHVSLAFPASDIQSVEWFASAPAGIKVNFFGLLGPSCVLPLYYTELAANCAARGTTR
jgi:type VI secretion system protein ImpH